MIRKFLIIPLLLISQNARAGHEGRPGLILADQEIYRERSGVVNHYYDEYFRQIITAVSKPHDNWLKSPNEFMGAMLAIVGHAKIDKPTRLHLIKSRFGFSMPAEIFNVYYQQILGGLQKRLQLTSNLAEVAATELERQALVEAGGNYEEYSRIFSRSHPAETRIGDLINFLMQKTKRSFAYDIPFMAGYAENDGLMIYIDRHVDRTKLINGKVYRIEAFLNVHEAVEKAVMDEFSTTYPHAHQNALRLEHAAVVDAGYEWEAYDKYCDPIIDTLGKETPKLVPGDLDLTPYYAYKDSLSVTLAKELQELKDMASAR